MTVRIVFVGTLLTSGAAFASHTEIVGLGLGLTTGLLLTPIMRWVAWRLDFVAEFKAAAGDVRSSIPYLGGIAVFGSLLLSATVFTLADVNMKILFHLLLGALPLTALGLLDDAWPLQPLPKAIFEAISAGLGLWLMGEWQLGPLWFGVYILLTVTVVNAVNFLDASDGFATATVSAAVLAMAVLLRSDLTPNLILFGALVGFLAFNRPPASIYLGDAGSHLLGAYLSFEIISRHKNSDGVPTVDELLVCLLLIGVPLFDLLFTVSARIGRGRAWWLGSRDHVVFRLRAAGLSKGHAALAIFLVQLALGALASAALGASTLRASLYALVILVAAGLCGSYLLRFDAG